MDKTIAVRVEDATDRQILIALVGVVQQLENTVTELSTAVTELRSAVADLGDRVTGQIVPLQDALASAQQSLTDFVDADNTEDADYQAQIDALTAELAARLGEAQAAATDIQTSVAEINAVAAAAEEPPVEEPPVEEPPAPVE